MINEPSNYNEDSNIEITKNFCYDNLALKNFSKNVLESLYRPPMHKSSDYKNWIAILDIKTCVNCKNLHGKIYYADEKPEKEPPLHERCRCKIEEIMAAFVGTATKDGINGADVYVSEYGRLPSNYITKKQAIKLGWSIILGIWALLHPKRLSVETFTETETVICLMHREESGMKQI